MADTKDVAVVEKEVGSDERARSTESVESHRDEQRAKSAAELANSPQWRSGVEPARTIHRPWLSFLGYLLLTIAPIMFIALAALCHMVKGGDAEVYQYDRLSEAYKISASIWPTAFGIIFGVFFKNLAHYWSVRRRTRLITLERLMASRTFGSAAMNLWYYGFFSLLGLSTFLLWTLSPLMQQPIQRMISKDLHVTETPINLTYVDTSLGPSQFASRASGVARDALISASLLTSTAAQATMLDLWLNPKAPLLPPSSGPGWQDFDYKTGTCASLLGIPVAGLPQSGNGSYTMESTSMGLVCSPIKNITVSSNDPAWKFRSTSGTFVVNYTVAADTSAAIQFASRFPAMNWGWAASANASSTFVETACNVSWVHVESEWACTDTRCMLGRVRPSTKHQKGAAENAYYNQYVDAFLAAFAHTDSDDPNVTTVMENYLFDPDRALEPALMAQNEFSFAGFEERLALILNTYWSAGFVPLLQVGGPVPTFRNDSNIPLPPSIFTQTTGTQTTMNYIIGCNDGWLGALLFGSSLMLIAAIAAAALRLATPGPDVFGYVGSMLRGGGGALEADVAGGSAMDGAEFAWAAGNVRLQLADVKGAEEMGQVRLTTEAGRPLQWGRRYR